MGYVGIDKVHATTSAYRVWSLDGWSRKGGETVGEDPPSFVRDHRGNPIPGTGFYLNTPTFTADLSPQGLLVKFNPSKILHPYKLLTDPGRVGEIGDEVQHTLRDHGLNVTVDDMQLSRLDLADQKTLRHKLSTYVPALAHLKGKRLTGHKYPEGYAWRNTQRETVFYSKAAELKEQRGIVIEDDRLARLEAKWRTGRPLAKDLQFSAFGDLCRADPDHLAAVYRNTLHRDVFRTDPKAVQLVFNFDTEVDILRDYRRQGRGGFNRYLLDASGAAHIQALGGFDALGELLRSAGYPARTARHIVQQLRTQQQRAAFVNARRDREAVNVHTLLDEIRNAFAA